MIVVKGLWRGVHGRRQTLALGMGEFTVPVEEAVWSIGLHRISF